MSAPDNAITLEEETDPKWWAENTLKNQWFTCEGCGYNGKAGELLVDPSGDNDTMWCPQCTTAAWVWD